MLETAIEFIRTNFLESVILILILSFFWHDEIKVVLYRKLGIGKKNGNGIYGGTGGVEGNGHAKTHGMMEALQEHFNDETTHLLSDILDQSKKAADYAEKSSHLLEEFKEYGIKTRDMKK